MIYPLINEAISHKTTLKSIQTIDHPLGGNISSVFRKEYPTKSHVSCTRRCPVPSYRATYYRNGIIYKILRICQGDTPKLTFFQLRSPLIVPVIRDFSGFISNPIPSIQLSDYIYSRKKLKRKYHVNRIMSYRILSSSRAENDLNSSLK